MKKDPVCGMEVEDTSNAESYVYKDKTYYFCTTLCKIQFEQDPEKYIEKENIDDQQETRE